MFTLYRTKVIFLKKENRGEADQLFTVFSEDLGKLEVLGKAIRKIKSKLRAGAEPFYFSEIEFIQGKTFKILTNAALINKFKNIRAVPQKLETAGKITNIVNILLKKEAEDNRIWKLLKKTLKLLDDSKLKIGNPLSDILGANKIKIIYYYFLWNFFSLLGFKPELFNCPICQKKLFPATFWFSAEEGGVICWQCFGKISAEKKKMAKEISVGTVKLLRFFLLHSQEKCLKIRLTEELEAKLKEISNFYLDFLKEEFAKSANKIKIEL